MSQSLSNIVVHLVFSTKGRRQLLRDEERDSLHAYITGILKNLDSPLLEINSVRDHIHILFVQSKNHVPAKVIEQIKTSSSFWIKGRATLISRGKVVMENSASARCISMQCASTSAIKRNIIDRKIFRRSIVVFARRTGNRWMNDMPGIDWRMCRPYRP